MANGLLALAGGNAVQNPYSLLNQGVSRTNNGIVNAGAVSTAAEDQNRGGLIGGIGYLGEKLGVGFVSSVEGIWDYAAGGIARLIGTFGSDAANKWAEEQIANDWFGDWYSHPEEWYNPSKGWQMAGDVAGGIGTSLPGIVTVAAAGLLSGGTLAPAAAAVIGGSTAGLGAAGRATKEAYQQTGQLGGKEFGYGALVGVTEGAIEYISGVIGAGSGVAIKALTTKFGKEAAQTVARQGVFKTLGKGFIGEAFEEGVAEILTPYYQRMTYDPNAKSASLSEVAYAAFVGGLSGMVMGGGTAAISTAANIASGNKLASEGKLAEVMGLSEEISAFEAQNNTEEDAFLYVKETREKLAESLTKTDGEVRTVQQKALLGDLNRANVAATFQPMILRSAATAVANADVLAERLSAYYKDADGNPVTVTAEDIRRGYDPENPKSLSRAIKSNEILRTLAVSDAVGRLSMDAKAFESAALSGKSIASMTDINRYLDTTPENEVRALGEKLGLDDIYNADEATFNEAVSAYAREGGLNTAARDEIVNAAKALPKDSARAMPKVVNLRNDGTVRYADADSDIAITKSGDEYVIYDYESDTVSRKMTRAEVNRALRQYQGARNAAVAKRSASNAQTDTNDKETPQNKENAGVTRTKAEKMHASETAPLSGSASELDAKARESVKGYNKLSEPNKAMVRRVLREATRSGLSDGDAALYASVSAHSGINIVFDKDACRVPGTSDTYANGFYDAASNRIVVNPDAENRGEALLIHEMDHAIRSTDKGFVRVFKSAVKGLSQNERTEIAETYRDFDASTIFDEYNAHFAEYALTDKRILERLLAEKPTLGQRILGFFKGAESDYADVPKLEGAAKRYYKQYKKMFDVFSGRNQQNNAFAGEASGEVKHSLQDDAAEYKKPITADDIEHLRSIGRKSINAFASEDIEKAQKWAYKFYREMGTKSPFFRAWFGDWRAYDTKTKLPIIPVNAETIERGDVPRGDFKNEDTGWSITSNSDGIDETSNKEQKSSDSYHALKDVDNLLKNAVLLDTVVVTNPSKRMGKNAALMHHMYCPINVNGKIGVAKLYIAESLGDKHKFYLMRIEKASTAMGFNAENGESTPHSKAATDDAMVSIAQIFEFVKKHHEDFEKNSDHYVPFEPKPVNPVLLNADGSPKVFYHGTNKQFTVFKPGYSGGIYLADNRKVSEAFTRTGNVMEVYPMTRKPLVVDALVSSEFMGMTSYKQSFYYEIPTPDVMKKNGYPQETVSTEEISAFAQAHDYDSVIITNVREIDGAATTDVIVFKPEQIKSATDNIGTFDMNNPDIRYSLPKASTNTKKSDADYLDAVNRGDTETAQKMVDAAAKDAGFTARVLHGTRAFGFTKPDVSKSDDGTSFFATDSVVTASAYSSTEEIKRIKDAKPYISDERLMEMEGEIYAAADRAAALCEENLSEKGWDESDILRGRVENTVVAAESGQIDEATAEKRIRFAFNDMFDTFAKAYVENKGDDGTVEEWTASAEGKRLKDEFMSGVPQVIAHVRDLVGADSAAGIYDLYMDVSNHLVIEGHGEDWNRLTAENLPDIHSPEMEHYRNISNKDYWTTRSVAQYAKDNGYSGVTFNDIIDGKRETSKVYVSLYPQNDVRSADPVTLDDQGYVIPPSLRFKRKSGDFRYSLPKDERISKNLNATKAGIVSDLDSREYKPTKTETAIDWWTSAQIAFTNAQAGIEKVGRILGIGDEVKVRVEAMRSAGKAAEGMIGGKQLRIGADVQKGQKAEVLGDGIGRIYQSVKAISTDAGADFDAYLLHQRHIDSMTLEERSQQRMEDTSSELERIDADITSREEKIAELGRKKDELIEKRKLRDEVKKLKAQRKALTKRLKALENMGSIENKAVLGVYMDEDGNPILTTVDSAEISPFTVEESREIIDALDKKYPAFKENAEAVWAYSRNLNQYRVDTGLITEEQFEEMQWRYPHYVPAYRADTNSGIGAIDGKYNLEVKKTVKTAKGSTKRVISPEIIIDRQTMETIRAGRANQLMRTLSDAATAKGNTTFIETVSRKKLTAEELAELDPTTIRPKGGEITFFRDGEMQTLRVSKEVFAGFDDFNTKASSNAVYDAVSWANQKFKALVTSASPAFIVRNGLRDIQDAGINTKYGSAFAKNYGVAVNQFRTGGEWLQEFIAFGGYNSSVFDFNHGSKAVLTERGREVKDYSEYTGAKKPAKWAKKALDYVEYANSTVEMIPRLAEYISAREAGASPEAAILAAADVTTNFGRSGKVTRVLNRTIVPFLNPSIQGFSKMIRNVTDAATAGDASAVSRAFGSLALRAALIGIVPMALNRMLYEDDEEYQNLREEDKENNYLLKLGDTFIKLPRGRVASAVAGIYNRTLNAAQGKDFDFAGYFKNLSTQVTPVDSASRNIFSPILRDLPTNTTWYGTAIEGQQFENMAPEERYDEGTSSIAIALGKVFKYSPKKIHYLLDQYSGVIGDFVLPATTERAEKDYISASFTLDPATSNKISTSFYKVYDELTYKKTAGDTEAALALKFLDKTKKAVSELYDRKTEVQKSDRKGADKLAETRTIQLEINALQLKALEDLEAFRAAIVGTSDIANDPTYATMIAAGISDEKLATLRFTEAARLVYGEAQALQWYDKEVYAKAELMNKAGLSYYGYYQYYFTTRGLSDSVDLKGKPISGSKRKKVVAAVNALNVSAQAKVMLLSSYGYKVQPGDIKGITGDVQKTLAAYILRQTDLSPTERVELLKICGFKVENGKVVLS